MARNPRHDDDDDDKPLQEKKPEVKDEPKPIAGEDKPAEPERTKTIEDHGIGAQDPYPTGGNKDG